MDIPTLFSDPITDIPATMHINQEALEYGVQILALPNIPFCGSWMESTFASGGRLLCTCSCGRVEKREVRGVNGAGVGLWIQK